MDLRQWMEQQGMTQAALAKLLVPPVSQGKINHWLSGARRVSLADALRLHALTGGAVSLQELAAMYRGPAVSEVAANDEAPDDAHGAA